MEEDLVALPSISKKTFETVFEAWKNYIYDS
jgi:hypothetical protein